MHGGIPSCLFEHTGMKGLWLRNTQLGGAAPATFSTSLIELGLEGNNLTGMLPAFNYSQFTFHCNLGHNSFACPLPAGVSDLCEATCESMEDTNQIATENRSNGHWSCQCASAPFQHDLCYTRWRCCTDSSMSTCDETQAWGDKPECVQYCDRKEETIVLV